MSTIGYEDWAVDLAEVGAVYPFQGGEGLLVFICVVFWLGWHVCQMKQEQRELEEERQRINEARLAAASDDSQA